MCHNPTPIFPVALSLQPKCPRLHDGGRYFWGRWVGRVGCWLSWFSLLQHLKSLPYQLPLAPSTVFKLEIPSKPSHLLQQVSPTHILGNSFFLPTPPSLFFQESLTISNPLRLLLLVCQKTYELYVFIFSDVSKDLGQGKVAGIQSAILN